MKTKLKLNLSIDYEGDMQIITDEIERQAAHMNIRGGSTKYGSYHFTVEGAEVE